MNIDINETIPPLLELITEHLDQERTEPVRRPRSPDEIRSMIDLSLGEQGRPLSQVVDQLRQIMAVTPSTATPRFFNQLFGGRDGAAMLGELMATVLNNSMYTYKVAGVHVLIELELVRRMGELVGFTDPEGIFTPGGSLSNLSGMVLARNKSSPDLKEGGADGRTLRIYTSVDSHYSVRKAAGLLGIGRDNVVKIPVDARGRMRPDALRMAILADLQAGHTPCMINATSGTTVLGAFDPLEPLADLAEEFDLWLHVDGAYGGTMIFHPELRAHFAGIQRADSITWDAHKMMGVPLTCSVFLVRRKGLLTRGFNETASYLFQDDTDDLNPGTRSLQCGRRNDTLKLWTAWRTHGDAGYRERMIALRDLALYARERVIADPTLELVREPESINLVFRVQGVAAEELCTTLNIEGRAMVGHAYVDDHAVVRQVFLDPTVQRSDIDIFFDELNHVAERLRAQTAAEETA